MTFARILLATDGSDNANRALDTAIDLATTYNASLTVLHAIILGAVPQGLLRWAEVEHLMPAAEESPGGPSVYGPIATLTGGRKRQAPYRVRQAVADAIVGHARERALARDVRDVQVRIADGDPTEVIAELLADGSHDLLVMGSRGHGTLRGLLTGSVSHKAIGLHACPVLVVP